MVRLSPSQMRASAGIATLAPTAVINPSRITMVPCAMTLPGPVTMRALRMACTRGVTAAAGTTPISSPAMRSSARDPSAREARRDGTADAGISVTSGWGAFAARPASDTAGGRATSMKSNGARRLGAREVTLQDPREAPPRPPDRRGENRHQCGPIGQKACAAHDGCGATAHPGRLAQSLSGPRTMICVSHSGGTCPALHSP
jgi:hypothetical protein